MADGKTQLAEAKGIEKDGHLMAHTNGAVLQVAIIKAETGIENDLLDTDAPCRIDLTSELVAHHGDWVGAEIKIADFTDVSALDIAKDDRGIVCSDEAEDFVFVVSSRQVKDACAGLEASAGYGRVIGFN